MRRITAAIASLHLLAAAGAAWAHGDPRELGHHWQIGEYRSEMWFQILAIVLTTGAYVIAELGVRAWKRRSIYRR
ncbi:MAG: hypothetical protein ACP5R5_03450 [Armatimonadota bacterium]